MDNIINQKITLYHGTTSKRAQSILSEGLMRIDADIIYTRKTLFLGWIRLLVRST